MDELERKGIVEADERGKFTFARKREKHAAGGNAPAGKARGGKSGGRATGRITGTLSMNRRGFGFVAVEGEEEDIYIAPRYLHTALHGDVVEVVLFAGRSGRRGRSDDERPEGEVVAIVERPLATVTGRLEAGRSSYFVVPDDERIARDIYVAREDTLGAKPGDKVVVRLMEWTDEHLNPEGTV
ncbi:MAG TPA: hypothetical protein VMM80_10335, partial [Bacteroidota bacterium]|nr:hypothetical protein [Bacteroidota bacterium]